VAFLGKPARSARCSGPVSSSLSLKAASLGKPALSARSFSAFSLELVLRFFLGRTPVLSCCRGWVLSFVFWTWRLPFSCGALILALLSV
jgi:hypothetical protein